MRDQRIWKNWALLSNWTLSNLVATEPNFFSIHRVINDSDLHC